MNNKEIIQYGGKKCSYEQFLALLNLVEENNYQNICNVGVYKGGSALIIGMVCQRKGSGIVHCVDPWQSEKNSYEEAYKEFKKSVSDLKLENICKIYKLKSEEFFKSNKEQFDFAFIDGDHSKTGVKQDILHCNAKTILCHDWEDQKGRSKHPYPGIKEAILELEKENKIEIIKILEFMALLRKNEKFN